MFMKYVEKTGWIVIIIAALSCSGSESPKITTQFEIESEVNVKANSNGTLEVSLIDVEGIPIDNATINIEVVSGDVSLNQTSYQTSTEGQVKVSLKTGDQLKSRLKFTYDGNSEYAGTDIETIVVTSYNYQVPDVSPGISSDDIALYDIDRDKIFNMVDLIRANSTKYKYINSLLIQKDDQLLLEEYFPYEELIISGLHTGENGFHLVASVSKSVTSACIGIAVAKGFINSIDDSILDYFPDRSVQNSADKERITIRNLLHMQSGLNCTDAGDWFGSNDFVQYHLDLAMVSDPGTTFRYCSGVTILLGAIIKNASGLDAQQFAQKYLFKSMRMDTEDTRWTTDPSGNVICGYNLWLKGRDMIKFGQLFLNEGVRNGQQLISKDWVESSTATGPPLSFANRINYGFQWWIGEHSINGQTIKAYYAIGNGGNYIINIPEFNSTVVFQAAEWNSNTIHTTVEVELMDRYILPALMN